MRSRIRILLIILSVSLNVAFVAAWAMKTIALTANAARPEQPVCSPGSNCRVWCPLHRALGTTDAQWEVLEPLQREFQLTSLHLTQRMDSLRAQLATLLAQPDAESALIIGKQEEVIDVQREMQALVVSHLLDEKKILTEVQQAKLFAMIRDNGACSGYRGMTAMESGGVNCPQKSTQSKPE